jgi:hypothetical protein
VDVEDNHVVILDLENGIKAAYLQCHFTPEYLRDYVLIGTRGRLEMEVEHLKLWTISRPDGHAWEKPPVRTDYPIDVNNNGCHGGGDPRIAQAFLDAVLHGIEPISDPLAGRMSVAVGCQAARSLRDGGVRHVPRVSHLQPAARPATDRHAATPAFISQ